MPKWRTRARDMTMFVDDNGKAYPSHSSEENLTRHLAELTGDCQGFTGRWNTSAPAGHHEAPALCKRGGQYYLITAGCTGWHPNAARSFVASAIWGPWQALDNPAVGAEASTTCRPQSTYLLPVASRKDAFLFMANRWTPKNPVDGGSAGCRSPLRALRWAGRWDLSVFDQPNAKPKGAP